MTFYLPAISPKERSWRLGASYDVIEALISDDGEAWALYEPLKLRGPGNPTGANQHTKDGAGASGTLYNVQDCLPEAPTGNTLAAGIRKLQKSAAEGNADAIRELAEVEAGRTRFKRGDGPCEAFGSAN